MNTVNVEALSDIEHIEQQMPLSAHIPFTNTYDAIRHSAELNSNKTAISFFLQGNLYQQAKDISYQTLLAKITQTANLFDQLGFTDNDVVAFFLPNLPETHYLLWGVQARSQVLAINPLLEPEQIRDLINSVQAKAVVTMNPMKSLELWPKLNQIADELVYSQYFIGVDIAQHVNGAKGFVAKTLQTLARQQVQLPAGKQYLNFTSAMAKQNATELNFQREFNSDTISSLYCTGGTTGLPKIARRSHSNELANVTAVHLSNQQVLNQDLVVLAGLPLFHVNGALVTGLLPFTLGAKVIIATPQGYREPNVLPCFWDIVEHHKVSTFSAVPTVYSALMNYPTTGKDLSSLKLGICGAAPMPVETFKAFQQATGIKILEGYGLTEGTCVSSLNPFMGEQRIGSIGLRLPFQQMQCVKVEGDKIVESCEVNEIGVLAVSGANVFLGYQLEHQNEGLWLYDDSGQRWLNTGDLARQDEQGYFWLTGRKKELIVRSGHNIEPKLIEEALCRHPQVAMAAAVGKPDKHAGEVPVCYVALAPNSKVTEQELLAFASAEIPERAAIPKAIHVLAELPVTAVGKVFKPQLEMQEIQKCILATASELAPNVKVEVQVGQDPKHGVLAQVTLQQNEPAVLAQLRTELGQYTFKSQVA